MATALHQWELAAKRRARNRVAVQLCLRRQSRRTLHRAWAAWRTEQRNAAARQIRVSSCVWRYQLKQQRAGLPSFPEVLRQSKCNVGLGKLLLLLRLALVSGYT